MRYNNYESPEILKFLKGRDFLLAEEHCWIDGYGQEIAITSMNTYYQLNCMEWLVLCLDYLLEENQEVKGEMKPLIVNKMNEFNDIFSIVVKKEKEPSKSKYKEQYKQLKKSFREKLHIV